MGWLFFIAPDQAFADEVTVQVSPTPSETSTATVETTAQTAVETAQAAVGEAQSSIQTINTQASSLSNPTSVNQAISVAQASIDNVNQNIQTVQSAVSDLNTAQAAVTQQTAVVQSATENVSQAQSAVNSANSAVSTATAVVESQTTVVETATTAVTNAQTAVNNATAAVETNTTNVATAQSSVNSATAVVATDTSIVNTATSELAAAQAVVNSNTTPGLKMTVYSDIGYNQSPPLGAGTVVGTTTDTNGINEQWGSGGPTITNSTTTTSTQTVTETFNNNQLNTNIAMTVNGTSVSTTRNDNIYIGSVGFPAPGADPSLNLQYPTAPLVIAVPSNTTSASFEVYAKNGDETATITYTDGTTETFVIQNDVSSAYPGYHHTETITAPAGKTIATITTPTGSDWYAIDNVSATSTVSTTTTTSTTVTEDFQVKWEGIWTPQYTGTQYITASADDGVKLYLDGELVINDWYDKGGGGSTADVQTTSGVGKTFEMWYYENGGGANVALKRYTGSGWEVDRKSTRLNSSH